VVDELRRRKVDVIGIDREPSSLPADLDGSEHLQLDASHPDSIRVVLDKVERRALRYIVNVAGGADPQEVEGSSDLDFVHDITESTLRTNFSTALYAVALARRLMCAASPSVEEMSVTLCSSVNAVGSFSYPLYSASKGAVESLVHALCVPLGRIRVRINGVRLGTVITDASLALHGGLHSPHYTPLLELSALGRFISLHEAAAALVVTAVELSGMTGVIIPVDAGQSSGGVR
jgi:NAD(P)-dependent dehydrogenase (short-subunit alcohol dehydrogenase family)